jgi:acyl-CoA synthetase (AMP-forming)/AMP-acid ligase II
MPTTLDVDAAALEKHRVSGPAAATPVRRLASCGSPLGCDVAIVHPERQTRCAVDEIGEVWLRGSSVASGYWERSSETATTFGATIRGECGVQYLRTGDLGFMREGELFLTGRIKDLIIIDGRNHYPSDIERTVEHANSAIRPGRVAAFSVESDGKEILVVAAEMSRAVHPQRMQEGRLCCDAPSERCVDSQHVRSRIRAAVAREHGIVPDQICLVRAGALAKTSSGKLRRRECRSLFLHGAFGIWSNR